MITRRLSTLLAAAGLVLVAGSNAASAATDPVSTVLNYLATPPASKTQAQNQYSAQYPNYNPNANLGQGSGIAGSFGR